MPSSSASASAPFRPWADLDAGLVSTIAACCALSDYASCRLVCGAWRCHPAAVSLAACSHLTRRWACSHLTRRWARLPLHHRPTWLIGAAGCRARCVGASSRDGWLALVAGDPDPDADAPVVGPVLFNPFTGEEIALDRELYDPAHEPCPKIVFSPNPTPRDFTAASLCRPDRVAVQRASDGCRSHVVDMGQLLGGDVVLVDVAYSDGDGEGKKVYCLAKDGEVHVLHLTRRRRCFRRDGRRVPPMEVGPLPRLPLGAVVFPPPYDVICGLTDAKNLVICDGALYQVWRRPAGSGNVTVDAPSSGPGGGGGRRWVHVFEGEVFVLRFSPGNGGSSPCWSVAEAKDLRGHALFVGMNEAAVVRGDGGEGGGCGVRANSVYYWDGRRGGRGDGDYEAVVYSMATGASVRWPAVETTTGGGVASPPVWYFLPPAGGTQRREEEPAEATAEVEEATSSGEATSSHELEEEEMDQSAHYCLKKTMSLLGRLDYSLAYHRASLCEV